MAMSRLQAWRGTHSLNENLMLYMNYDVYADMASVSATPYLRLNGCMLYTAEERYNQVNLGSLVPATLRIQVAGGSAYSFTLNGVQHHPGTVYDLDTHLYLDEYYYVEVSSSTNVLIPKDGVEFVLNISVTLRNGTVLSTEEHLAGPMANSLSGPTSINTGAIATYRLGRSVTGEMSYSDHYNVGLHRLYANLYVVFPNQKHYNHSWNNGYPDGITPVEYTVGTISQMQFAVPRVDVPVGTVASANSSTDNYNDFLYRTANCIHVEYRYYSIDMGSSDQSPGHGRPDNNYIVISRFTFGVTVTARSAVDNALKPIFYNAYDKIYDHKLPYSSMANRYGAGIQGHTGYDLTVSYQVVCGNVFKSASIMDYRSSSWRIANFGANDPKTIYSVHSGAWLLNTVLTNSPIRYQITDTFGITTSYTDIITVKAYHLPVLTTHNARRCSEVSFGSGSGYYTYDGHTYRLDDNGDHVLIEWGISITPIDNLNSRSLTIEEPKPEGQTGTKSRSISLSSYDDSGFFITYADPEQSYDIVFTLNDDMTREYSSWIKVQYVFPLNTAISAIDFLRGGHGIAFGKVAELDHVIDIHRSWQLNMPYNTLIQNYNANGTAARMYDWMQSTSNRIQAITDSRDIAIFSHWTDGLDALHDNNTVSCIPAGYGTVSYPVDYAGIMLHMSVENGVAGLLIGDDITIARRYLYVNLSTGDHQARAASFIAPTKTGPATKPSPVIYVMGTKPTTINQSTGVPNGTILTQVNVGGVITAPGSVENGYQYMEPYYEPNYHTYFYIDVSSFRGRRVWIVATVARGVTTYNDERIVVGGCWGYWSILQTDNRQN